MKLVPVTMRHLRNYVAMVIPVLFLLALAGEAFAATYDFAGVGTASGGFKPQGNRFLVSDMFENDEAPNTTAIWYNSSATTVNGMIIKADGTNLTSFNLTDMKFTIYAAASSAEDISSLKITGTKVGGATVNVTVNPPSTAPGASFTLVGLGTSLSDFTDITQLTFDITTNNGVYYIDFSTITLTNEVFPTINPPTTQATGAQAVVVGQTELTLGWTSGNGGSRVVFANQGATTGAPTVTNGTPYAANSVFTSATDIGGGWKCVYNGNGSFAQVSGLTASTPYRFVVFEYNGSSGNEKYLATVAGNAANLSTIGSFGDWTRGDIAGLDGTNNFWTWTDADRDANGNIYVGHKYNYLNDTSAQFRIEKWNGSGWSNPTSFTASSAGYAGFSDHSGIAVTGADQLSMVFCGAKSGAGTITEAKYNGSAWSFSDAEATSITNTSLNDPVIAVDGTGKSHILYEYSDARTGSRFQYIKLASWNGTAWSIQTLSTIANDNDVDNGVQNDYLLLNDASNKQHVFYIRMTTTGRELHHWTNSASPATDTIIFSGNTNSPYKLYGAIDSSGKFHLAYGEDALLGRKVMYLTDKSGSWVSQPLLISTAGWQKGFAPLELRINSSGDMVIPVRSQNDKVFKALLKQGSNPWKISALSPVDALTDDWEDTGFSYNTTGVTFRDDGKATIAFANGLSARPRRLMYTTASLYTNTAPTFVDGATGTLTVNQNASATDIKGLLHVSDPDSGQTLTWSQSVAPNHGGTLNIVGTTVSTGAGNITPSGTITYQPSGIYSGTETFTVQVSDGTAMATRQITVTINPTYTVTYNANGATSGSVPTDGNSYANGTMVTVKSNSGSLVRNGYTFAGWNTAANGGGSSYSPGNTFAMGSSNVTLYAQWTPVDYTVTYNGNTNTGGSAPTDATTYHITDTVTVLGNTGMLVKTGYTFAGWNTAANGSGSSYSPGNTFAMGSSNVTLYAQWLEIPVATAASSVTSDGFTANWGVASGATGYYLDVATDSGFGAGTLVAGFNNLDVGNVTTKAVTGLSPYTSYHFRVRAYYAVGTSGNSNAISLSTFTRGISVILVNPDTPENIVAGLDGAGIWRSTDSGANWSAAAQPVNKRVMMLVMHPTVHATLFAATYGGGVFTSSDSGVIWSACANNGLSGSSLNLLSLAVDSSGRLYAGTEAGIFTSSDCTSWSAVNTGLTVDAAKPPVAIAVDPANAANLCAGLDGAGVFRSSNGGVSWTAATTQPSNLRVKGLVLKPEDSTKQFVATYGGGVFTSVNSGVDWSACGAQPTNLNTLSLTIDGSGKLYAGTEGGVFVSTDGCATWTMINSGLP